MSGPAAPDVAALPAGPALLRVYLRHCFLPSVGDPDPLWVNARAPSRWWTPRGTLYVAEDEVTVMAEYCRNNPALVDAADPTGAVGLNARNFAAYAALAVGAPLPARAVFSVDVAFDRLADLRSPRTLAVLAGIGVNPGALLADDYGPCPALAQAGERAGWQAVRATSAANPDGTSVAIFRDAFPSPAAWRVLRPTARPSIRAAALTRYRAGERPAWLGR